MTLSYLHGAKGEPSPGSDDAEDGGDPSCARTGSPPENQCGRRRSIRSRIWSPARRSGGTSSAISSSPSGSIQIPNSGKTLRKPPPTSTGPAKTRTQREEGRRNQRVVVCTRSGRRSISLSTRSSPRRLVQAVGANYWQGFAQEVTWTGMVAPRSVAQLRRGSWPVLSGRVVSSPADISRSRHAEARRSDIARPPDPISEGVPRQRGPDQSAKNSGHDVHTQQG